MSNDKVIEELRAKRKADLEDLIDQIVEFNPEALLAEGYLFCWQYHRHSC